jgi:LysM repeat protein
MIMCRSFFICAVLLFSSCTSNLAFRRDDPRQSDLTLDELRMELADVKHALNSTQVELSILEDRMKNQDSTLYAVKNQAVNKMPQISQLNTQINSLENRIGTIEKNQEKTLTDLRQLSSHANLTAGALSQYKEKIQELEREIASQNRKFEEFIKLKSTLASISKLMKQNAFAEESVKTYKVQTGDSLERIARQHRTTVDVLKKINRLESDLIMAGQELKIPYDGNGS